MENDDYTIFVTNHCNSNCIMCPMSEKERSLRHPELNYEYLMKQCRDIPVDTKHVTITGGEPFLFGRKIFEALHYLRDNFEDIPYLFLTNGRAFSIDGFSSQYIDSIPPQTLTGIPIHGSCAEKHDFITQAPGSFEETEKGLYLLLEKHAQIELRIVASKLNIQDITSIAKLIADHFVGVHAVRIMGLEMLGNARKNLPQVWIDYRESFPYIREAVEILVDADIDVQIYNYPLCCVEPPYWGICKKSISPDKVRYAEQCNNCSKKDACGGVFLGTLRLLERSLSPL